MAVKTVELKVARRLSGVMGALEAVQTQNAGQNRRLLETSALVEQVKAEIAAMSERTGAEFKALRELVESLFATVAYSDQVAHGRMDSIMARVCALEPAPIVSPVEAVEVAPAAEPSAS